MRCPVHALAVPAALPDDVVLMHPTSRGVALYRDRVFFAAGEAVLVALDVRTGDEVWQAKVADNRQGYYMSLAPLVADGKVMVGVSGGCLTYVDSLRHTTQLGQGVVEDVCRASSRRAGE